MALLSAASCKAPPAHPTLSVKHDAALAARIESVRSGHGVPGMGAAIVAGDGISIAVAGKRRVDRGATLEDGDAFHLGSDTKAMTDSVVARLVERGVLHWDETLAEALPGSDWMDPAFRTVTLEMLMRHMAGLPSSGAFTAEFTAGFDETWPIARQRAWMAQRFLSRPPAEPPGTKFLYSNYGLLIVGHVVERATGTPWEELMRREVFEPLGMTGCGFGPTASAAHPDNNWAHDVHDGTYVPTEEDNPPLIGPAGTVHCTLESWARFAAAHAHPERADWLKPDSLAHLHEPLSIPGAPPGKDIALGWGVVRTEPTQLTHGGSNGYNVAEIVVIPKRHAAVLVTVNAGDDRAHAAAKELSEALVKDLLR